MNILQFSKIKEEAEEFNRLRRIINRDLSDDIQAAEGAGWEAGRIKQIKEDIRRLLSLATSLSIHLLVVAVILAVVVVAYVATSTRHGANTWWYRLVGTVALAIAAAALWLYWPLVGIVRAIRALPQEVYRNLIRPIRINLDLLNIAVNVVVLLYVLLPLRIGGAYPLVLIALGVWLFAPLGLFFAGRDGWFMGLRIAQLAVLFAAASFVVVSPVPMSQYQWRAQRQMADSLRVADQHELTARWTTLRWFTPEGVPLVWYSYRNDGYHLYASPGHDPLTNAELAEVADDGTRQKIVADLKHRKEERERDETARLADEKARAEREKVDTRHALVRKFVYPQFADGSSKSATALIALDENGRDDAGLGARLSAVFKNAGYVTVAGEFTPAFVGSEVFSALDSGNGTESAFPVADYATRILVIRPRLTVSHDTAVGTENLTTALVVLNIRLIQASSGRVEFENEVSGRGVAYKEATARADAFDRAQSALSTVATQLAALK